MPDVPGREDELFKLELASHMPAKDQSFSDWAISNPEDEYALWMTIRYPEEKVESEMQKRVRRAERAPKWAIARAGALATFAASLDTVVIEHAVREGRAVNALIIGAISLLPFNLARLSIKDDLPQARGTAKRERELFERGMQARTLAKMTLENED